MPRIPLFWVLSMLMVSFSNGSKSVVLLWVRVGTDLEPLQGVSPNQKTEPHRTHGFLAGSTFLPTQNFGSTKVFEFWSYLNMIYTYKMQVCMLFHPPVSTLWSYQYSLCYGETCAIFGATSQQLNEYWLDRKVETSGWKSMQNYIFYIYIIL